MLFEMKNLLATIFFIVTTTFVGISQTVGLTMANIVRPSQSILVKKEKLHIFSSLNAQNQQVAKTQPRAVPSVFSVETLPFFCKIEYKMGFNKKLPIKFRLGDVQYVDEMEGKH